MITAWLYRRRDLEIVRLVDLPGELPDSIYYRDVQYQRRGVDLNIGRAVYVEATVLRVEFAESREPPPQPDAGVELIDDTTKPLAPMPAAKKPRTFWDD